MQPTSDQIFGASSWDRDRVSALSGNWILSALAGVPAERQADLTRELARYFLWRGMAPAVVRVILEATIGAHSTPPLAPDLIAATVAAVSQAENVDTVATLQPVRLADALETLAASLEAGPAPTVPTPFGRLNYLLSGGFGPGDLVYLGARPGVGKTGIALAMARRAAEQGPAVLVVSREMTTLALTRRMVSQASRVSASHLKASHLSHDERETVSTTMVGLRRLPVWMTDQAIRLDQIEALVTDMVLSAPVGLVVVDYLQLVRPPAEIKDRRLQVEAISSGLKSLAMQCQVPVLCLSSLARPPDRGKERMPTLDSLRESGSLEHDADLVLFLHREYGSSEATIRIAKNRDGRVGEVKLLFHPETVTFEVAVGDPGSELFET